MTTLYTVQLANSQIAMANGIQLIDITVKSGIKEFAPTWELLMAYKSGKIDWRDYAREYNKLMDQSKRQHPTLWSWLYALESDFALACYCKPGRNCHRHILKDTIMSERFSMGEIIIDGGELTADRGVLNNDDNW